MSERKYKLVSSIRTPFGSWQAGEIKTEQEWRSIAPNGGDLVEFLDLEYDFEPVIDGQCAVWLKDSGMPVLLMRSVFDPDKVGQWHVDPQYARDIADAYTEYADAYARHIANTTKA